MPRYPERPQQILASPTLKDLPATCFQVGRPLLRVAAVTIGQGMLLKNRSQLQRVFWLERSMALLSPNWNASKSQALAIRRRNGRRNGRNRIEPNSGTQTCLSRPGVSQPALIDRAQPIRHHYNDGVDTNRCAEVGPIPTLGVNLSRNATGALDQKP